MKADAPPWFANVFDFLLKDLNSIKSSCSDYQATKGRSIANASEITQLKIQFTKLESKQSITDAKISKLMEENAKLESFNRRDNLLLDGINHFTPKLLRLIFQLVRTPNIFSCTKLEMNLV